MKSSLALEKIKTIFEFKKRHQEFVLAGCLKSSKQRKLNIEKIKEIIISYALPIGEIQRPSYLIGYELFLSKLYFLIEHEKTQLKNEENAIASIQKKLAVIQVKIDFLEKRMKEIKQANWMKRESIAQKDFQNFMILEQDAY